MHVFRAYTNTYTLRISMELIGFKARVKYSILLATDAPSNSYELNIVQQIKKGISLHEVQHGQSVILIM